MGRLRTALDLSGGAQTLNVNGTRAVRPAVGATLVVLYGI
jgi:hypothetical protein